MKHADFDFSVSDDGTQLIMTAKKAGVAANVGYTVPATGTDIQTAKGGTFSVTTVNKGADSVENPNGDYNVATTVIRNVTAADSHRIASTHFDLTKDMVTEGSVLTIGDQKFTFTSNADMLGLAGYVDISSGDLDNISENLTKAAEDNHVGQLVTTAMVILPSAKLKRMTATIRSTQPRVSLTHLPTAGISAPPRELQTA